MKRTTAEIHEQWLYHLHAAKYCSEQRDKAPLQDKLAWIRRGQVEDRKAQRYYSLWSARISKERISA